jgi:peptidoglycan-N-acetylglucosamine deacetylase
MWVRISTDRRSGYNLQIIVLAMMVSLAAFAPGAMSAEVCWSPQELRDVEGGQSIQKDVSRAYVPVPRSQVASAPPSFRPVRGAIRRVNLPQGAPKLVALTFDLCEQPYEVAGYQGKIVDFLRDRSVKATFFAGGKWMLTHARRAQQLMSDPLFEVANHSWEHRNLRIITGAKLDDEIRGAQAAYELTRAQLVSRQCVARDGKALQRAVPSRMSLFRFPFGACNAKALEAVGENGLYAVQWDVSSGDPDRNVSVRAMVDTVSKAVRSGSIVLFHANGRGWSTAEALPIIVSELAAANYKFVTVSELLTYPGAKWDVSESCYDAHQHDTDRYDGLARTLETRYEKFYSRFAPSEAVRSDAARARSAPAFDTQIKKE